MSDTKQSIHVLFVHRVNGKLVLEEKDIESSLKAYYALLGCELVDGYPIGLGMFVYLDDEGRFKPGNDVTARFGPSEAELEIVGPLLVCRARDDGEEESLSPVDVEILKASVKDDILQFDAGVEES